VQSVSKETLNVTFLYMHEKIVENVQNFKGQEYWTVCFDRFYSQVSRLHDDFQIKLRIHPKDNPKDFIKFVSARPGVALSYSNLAVDIAQSDIIVGVRSAALEIARNCGKPVFTTNFSPDLRLPGPLARLPTFEDTYVP